MTTLKSIQSSLADHPDRIVVRACLMALMFVVGLLAGEARAEVSVRGSSSPVVQGIVVSARLVDTGEGFDDFGRRVTVATRQVQEITVRGVDGQLSVVFQDRPFTEVRPGAFVLVIRPGKRVLVQADTPGPALNLASAD